MSIYSASIYQIPGLHTINKTPSLFLRISQPRGGNRCTHTQKCYFYVSFNIFPNNWEGQNPMCFTMHFTAWSGHDIAQYTSNKSKQIPQGRGKWVHIPKIARIRPQRPPTSLNFELYSTKDLNIQDDISFNRCIHPYSACPGGWEPCSSYNFMHPKAHHHIPLGKYSKMKFMKHQYREHIGFWGW